MSDLEALKNNAQILNNIVVLLQRSPHTMQERPTVDQCIGFISGLLAQSKKLEEELVAKEQPAQEEPEPPQAA